MNYKFCGKFGYIPVANGEKSPNPREQELEKGCGKQYYDIIFKDVNICDGNSRDGICPECKAELKGFKQGQLSQKERDLKIVNDYRNTEDGKVKE